MEAIAVVILAAGLGKRMGLGMPKVLVRAGGRTLISHVLNTAYSLNPERLVVVAGFGAQDLKDSLAADGLLCNDLKKTLRFAIQPEQLGTGHAVRCALKELEGFSGTVLILCGDVPRVKSNSLRALLSLHKSERATLSLISFSTGRQNSYGRVARLRNGAVRAVVELRDCGSEEAQINEFNSGIYAVDGSFLSSSIAALKNDNAQKEYYLTDIVSQAVSQNLRVSALLCDGEEEFQGINNLSELAMVNAAFRNEKISALLERGVQFEDPTSSYVDPQVEIAPGTIIGPNVQIYGDTRIGAGVRFEGSAWISNCRIEDGALIRFCVRAENAVIGPKASVGPFAHLRPGTVLDEEVRVGNFVETKNSHLAARAKASHLTYLGDANVGAGSNIGAGTITCNYDGVNKNKTTIEDGVFIGSNSCLVAPVKVGEGAYVGAGSVITKDVEKDALALTRPELVVKKDWARRKRGKSGH